MNDGADSIAVGAPAPEFALRDQHNVVIGLSDFRGRAVLLVFYPLAFTGVCAGELNLIQADLEALQNEDVQVLGVSVDSPYTLRVFADNEGLKFPLLSDFWPHGAVAKTYGVFNEASGMANRGTFVIDRDGVVRFSELNEPGMPRDQADWQRALEQLPA